MANNYSVNILIEDAFYDIKEILSMIADNKYRENEGEVTYKLETAYGSLKKALEQVDKTDTREVYIPKKEVEIAD